MNENVSAYMLMAEKCLRDSRYLLQTKSYRSAAGRAYYDPLFDGILALLQATDGPIPKTHTGTHNEFRKQFIQTELVARTYSDTITELFNLRQDGDYEIDFDISLEDTQDAVQKAAEFLRQTEAYLRQNGFAS